MAMLILVRPLREGVLCTLYQSRYQPRPANVSAAAAKNASRLRMGLPPVIGDESFFPAHRTAGRCGCNQSGRPGPVQTGFVLLSLDFPYQSVQTPPGPR